MTGSPARPALLRALNDSTVLGLLADSGPLTRAALAAGSELSKPTVAESLPRLTASGLVVAAGDSPGRPGPNGRLWTVRPHVANSAAVGLTPTSRTLIISDIHGNELAEVTQRRNGSTQSPLDSVRSLLETACRDFAIPRRSITQIVIGVPGTYDPATDTASLVGRLPEWNASGIRTSLEDGLKAVVTIENDANLALVAERRLGAASDLGTTALLWIGAGLGLALNFSNGTTPYSGAHGRAGEVGYLPVSLPQDTTGLNTARRPVDLQDLIGGSAIVRLANAYGIRGRDPERVVQRAVAVNEKNTQDFLEALGERITIGIAPIAAVVDPDVVVLGGPIGQAGGERLAKETRRHVSRLRAFSPRVIATTVAVDPVLAGSRLMAVDRARDHVLTQVTTDASDAAFVSGLLMRS